VGDRKPLVLAALAACVAAAAVAIGVAASGGDEGGGLLVERAQSPRTGQPELLVSVEEGDNTPDKAGGRGAVTLQCFDSRGGTTLRAEHAWPFTNDGSTPLPHVHQPGPPEQIAATARCRLSGTGLEGAVRRG
jgi:hypothetical protein